MGTDFDLDGGLVEVSHPVLGKSNDSHRADAQSYVPDIVPQAMSSKWAKGSSGPAGDEVGNLVAGTLNASGKAAGSATQQDVESGLLVAHALKAEGHDASEDGTGRGTPIVADTLRQHPHPTSANPRGIAFSANASEATPSEEVAPTMRAMPHDKTHANSGHQVAVAYAIQGAATRENPSSGPDGVGVRHDDTAYTLEARSEVQSVASAAFGVRRLTPRECERLQGFPDDYTLVPHGKNRARDFKEWVEYLRLRWSGLTEEEARRLAADGPRYKAIGNSMAVPVMAWIGRRIQSVEDLR